jgi:formylglycine-generating enzyme required for sulfatase activity
MFIKFMQISFIKLLYEEENDMKNNKGITLVALVVTIVVLLILAGVSINLVLGNNGIIAKAKEAETKSAEASQNDLKGMNGLVSEMEGALAGNGSTGSGSGNGNTGSGNNFVTKNTEVTYPDGKVWIPEGFKVADDSASTVQGGVVIEDKDRNQFVWVPVATLADYKRTAYSTNVATEETDTATNSIKINYSSSKNSEYFTEALPEDEKTSVERYKGFYIGRYEAGDKENTEAKTLRSSNDVTKTVTIKANQAPYNNVTKTQAISLAEGFATKQGYKAKTKLVSSYAWDTTIAFMQKVNSDYGSSSEEGNYKDTTFSYTDITGARQTKAKNSNVLVPTGQTTPVCNIYDMGGNVFEWTTESCSNTDYPYARRGGFYYYIFANIPAGFRDDGSDDADDGDGFRLTLFM